MTNQHIKHQVLHKHHVAFKTALGALLKSNPEQSSCRASRIDRIVIDEEGVRGFVGCLKVLDAAH